MSPRMIPRPPRQDTAPRLWLDGRPVIDATVELRRDQIDITSASESYGPDPDWRFVDAAGHAHAWIPSPPQPERSFVPDPHADPPVVIKLHDLLVSPPPRKLMLLTTERVRQETPCPYPPGDCCDPFDPDDVHYETHEACRWCGEIVQPGLKVVRGAYHQSFTPGTWDLRISDVVLRDASAPDYSFRDKLTMHLTLDSLLSDRQIPDELKARHAEPHYAPAYVVEMLVQVTGVSYVTRERPRYSVAVTEEPTVVRTPLRLL